MDCPRCRLSLAEAEYESERVHFCGQCWGYWLTRTQLDQIAGGVKYRFGKGEARTIQGTLDSHGDANRQGSEHEAVPCPVCGGTMKTKKYSRRLPRADRRVRPTWTLARYRRDKRSAGVHRTANGLARLCNVVLDVRAYLGRTNYARGTSPDGRPPQDPPAIDQQAILARTSPGDHQQDQKLTAENPRM